eukprot:9793886-Lingulodinium_polyedra.AAC.1
MPMSPWGILTPRCRPEAAGVLVRGFGAGDLCRLFRPLWRGPSRGGGSPSDEDLAVDVGRGSKSIWTR